MLLRLIKKIDDFYRHDDRIDKAFLIWIFKCQKCVSVCTINRWKKRLKWWKKIQLNWHISSRDYRWGIKHRPRNCFELFAENWIHNIKKKKLFFTFAFKYEETFSLTQYIYTYIYTYSGTFLAINSDVETRGSSGTTRNSLKIRTIVGTWLQHSTKHLLLYCFILKTRKQVGILVRIILIPRENRKKEYEKMKVRKRLNNFRFASVFYHN